LEVLFLYCHKSHGADEGVTRAICFLKKAVVLRRKRFTSFLADADKG